MVETRNQGGGRPNLVATCAWLASLLLVNISTATLQQLYSVFLKQSFSVVDRDKKQQICRRPVRLCTVKVKGKAVPLQAWSGPEGSRKLMFPDFVTTAQDGDKVVSLTHRPPLPPGNTPGTHFC